MGVFDCKGRRRSAGAVNRGLDDACRMYDRVANDLTVLMATAFSSKNMPQSAPSERSEEEEQVELELLKLQAEALAAHARCLRKQGDERRAGLLARKVDAAIGRANVAAMASADRDGSNNDSPEDSQDNEVPQGPTNALGAAGASSNNNASSSSSSGSSRGRGGGSSQAPSRSSGSVSATDHRRRHAAAKSTKPPQPPSSSGHRAQRGIREAFSSGTSGASGAVRSASALLASKPSSFAEAFNIEVHASTFASMDGDACCCCC